MSFEPTTILSGYVKSLIASPSLKNSGFDTTENLLLLFFLDKIFSISSPVVTGTVDLASDFGEGTYDIINKGMDNRQGRIDNRAARIEGRYGSQGGYGGQMGGYGSQGGYGGPMGQGATNPYTYNGQLQQKPESNFLPLTADFSAFAK